MNAPALNSTHPFHVHFQRCILLTVLGVLVYGNHLQNPFQYDTVSYISNQHRLDNIDEQLSLSYLKKEFFHRGLLQISVALNARLDGFRPFGYHLVNFIFHLANSLLIYFITCKAWRYFRPGKYHPQDFEIRSISLFTAMLFLLHPIQTESVVYIMSRSEVFAGTFYLSAFLLLQACLDPGSLPNTRLRVIAVFIIPLIFVLGFSVKQTVITLPMMLLLYFLIGQSSESRSIRLLNKFKWGIGIVSLVGLLLLFRKLLSDESFLIGPSTAGEDIGRLNYMLTQPSVILFYYLKLFLWPINLNVDPDIPMVTQWWSWRFWSSFMVILSAIYFSFKARGTPFIFFLVCWFIVVISPSSSIITLNDLGAEHRTYLASYAFYAVFGILVYLVSHFIFPHQSINRRFLILGFSIFISVSFSLLTVQRNEVWTSEVLLWSDAVKKSPEKIRPMINLARAHTTVGNFDLAVNYYEKAHSLNPNVFATNYNLGNLYMERGRKEDALLLFRNAALIAPHIPEVHGILGEIYLKKKQIELAEYHLTRAVEIKPDYAVAMRNLGIINYFHLEKPNEAATFFSRSLSIEPNQAEADNIRILIQQIRKQQ